MYHPGNRQNLDQASINRTAFCKDFAALLQCLERVLDTKLLKEGPTNTQQLSTMHAVIVNVFKLGMLVRDWYSNAMLPVFRAVLWRSNEFLETLDLGFFVSNVFVEAYNTHVKLLEQLQEAVRSLSVSAKPVHTPVSASETVPEPGPASTPLGSLASQPWAQVSFSPKRSGQVYLGPEDRLLRELQQEVYRLRFSRKKSIIFKKTHVLEASCYHLQSRLRNLVTSFTEAICSLDAASLVLSDCHRILASKKAFWSFCSFILKNFSRNMDLNVNAVMLLAEVLFHNFDFRVFAEPVFRKNVQHVFVDLSLLSEPSNTQQQLPPSHQHVSPNPSVFPPLHLPSTSSFTHASTWTSFAPVNPSLPGGPASESTRPPDGPANFRKQ